MEPIEDKADDLSQSLPRIKPRRIDPAHPMEGSAGTAPVHSELAADAVLREPAECRLVQTAAGELPPPANPFEDLPALDEPPADLPEELATETAQLARSLQEQLREVEYREAQLHARQAEVENEWRACRAWHEQRLDELGRREEELRRRQAEMEVFAQQREDLQQRLDDCLAQEEELDRREARLVEREATLVAGEHDLRLRRQEVERQAAALSRSQQLWEQTRSREQQAIESDRARLAAEIDGQLAQRQAELESAQALVLQQTRELQAERDLLARQRQAWEAEQRRDQQQLDEARRRLDDESQKRHAQLAARESALDTQQAALEQLRNEILAAHRQALQMRLAAEQLWAQLKGLMTPAEITHSLAQIRLKLAEQYELEEKALAEKKEELLRLSEKLAEQHAAIKAQRIEFLAWRKAQTAELQQQAEHLCRRIQELDEDRKALRQSEQSRQEGGELTDRLNKLPGHGYHLPPAA
jgi:hypothetical protein